MTACVVDGSALMLAVGDKSAAGVALRARLAGLQLHAPHLIDAETGNVLRRHEREGLLSAGEAEHARRAARALVRHRYPHCGRLGELAWTLRHNPSFYDALYVALAAVLDVALVTADERLSRAPKLPCAVELV